MGHYSVGMGRFFLRFICTLTLSPWRGKCHSHTIGSYRYRESAGLEVLCQILEITIEVTSLYCDRYRDRKHELVTVCRRWRRHPYVFGLLSDEYPDDEDPW